MQRETYEDDDQVELKDASLYREWTRMIMRQWRGGLSGSELHVLLFITDRTLGWGKQWERITRKHFKEGIRSRDGSMVAAPIPLSSTTIDTAIKKLERDGLILIRERGAFLYFSINYEMSTDDDNLPKRPQMRRPKQPKQQQQAPPKIGGRPPQKLGGDPPQKLGININKENRAEDKLFPSGKVPAAPSKGERLEPGEVKDVIVALAEGNRDSHRQRVRRHVGGIYTPAALRSLWQQHAPDVTLKEKDVHALRGMNKRWTKTNKGDFAELLAFALTRWTVVVSYWFNWMDRPPERPNPLFLVKWNSHFEEAWLREEFTDQLAAMTRFGRLVHRHMSEDGMTDEAARAHVCKKYSLQDDTDPNNIDNRQPPPMRDITQHTPTGASDALRQRRRNARKRREARKGEQPFGSFDDE